MFGQIHRLVICAPDIEIILRKIPGERTGSAGIKYLEFQLQLLNWVDFTRAIPDNTLFGREFGNLVRPPASLSPHTDISNRDSKCFDWSTTLRNRYFLCVSVFDLCDITERTGEASTNPITVAP